MATGANDNYWRDARLPGVLKHSLLKRYLPVFLIRTSSIAGRAAYFDGFAGRGVYEDGKLGSAGEMLEFTAGRQYGPAATPISLYLCEKDKESFAALDALCNKYRAKHIDVQTRRDDARNYLRESLPSFSALPAFLFLDPCGVGIPFDDLVAALNRGGANPWPPTEALIKFQPRSSSADRRPRHLEETEREDDADPRRQPWRRLVARILRQRCYRRGCQRGGARIRRQAG